MLLKKTFSAGVVCLFLLTMTPWLIRCTSPDNSATETAQDSTATVYGPYRFVRLPITQGVKILNPIQLALGPGGKIFAANQTGEVYTLVDTDGDGLEDKAVLYCNINEFGLRSPGGFTYKGDTIYIGTAQEIRAFLDRDKDDVADSSWTFFKDIPHSEHPYEWTSGLNFGPDGWLYCALSTDSWNAGASPDPKGYRGAILRISPDGKTVERVATGIRSVFGMAFNEHGDLFFTDNEGGGNAKEELNWFNKNGFYGHNPKKYPGADSSIAPAHVLQTELAPAKIEFNRHNNDFGGTAGDLFIAFYGPGERWDRGAVARITIKKPPVGSYQYVETPIADVPKLSGLAFSGNGDLYLAHHGKSDYWYNPTEERSGGFYKLIYDAGIKNYATRKTDPGADNLSVSSVEEGKLLFAQRACSACHTTKENEAELLGPGLAGIGKRLSRDELLEEIEFPSRIIKPSMGAMRITKKNGQILLGRVVNAGQKEISLMLIGNQVVTIPRNEILKSEDEKKSLMYENLLSDLSKEQVNSLLDYMLSLQ